MASDIENTDDVKKKRILQNAEDIADLIGTLADRLAEMTGELGVPPMDILALAEEHIPQQVVAGTPVLVAGLLAGAMNRVYSSLRQSPMEAHIAKIFASAPKMTDGSGKPQTDQAPAAECDVILKCGQAMAGGALSTTPQGLYRYGAVAQQEVPSRTSPNGKRTVAMLVEMTFELEQIAGIATKTEIHGVSPSALVRG